MNRTELFIVATKRKIASQYTTIPSEQEGPSDLRLWPMNLNMNNSLSLLWFYLLPGSNAHDFILFHSVTDTPKEPSHIGIKKKTLFAIVGKMKIYAF